MRPALLAAPSSERCPTVLAALRCDACQSGCQVASLQARPAADGPPAWR